MAFMRRPLLALLLVVGCRAAPKSEALNTSGGSDSPPAGSAMAATTAATGAAPPPPDLQVPGAASKDGDGVRGAVLSSSGKIPPDAIQSVVQKEFPKLRACWESGKKTNAKLEGTVQVKFTIGKEGNVTSASREPETTVGDPAVVDCVLSSFKRLTFPKPEGGVVNVVYPVVFRSE